MSEKMIVLRDKTEIKIPKLHSKILLTDDSIFRVADLFLAQCLL